MASKRTRRRGSRLSTATFAIVLLGLIFGNLVPALAEATPETGTTTAPAPAPGPAADAPDVAELPPPPAPTAGNVARVLAAVDADGNGKLDDTVTITSAPGTHLENVKALPVPTDPAPPVAANFAYGLFDYDVIVDQPGAASDVTITLPSGPATADVFMLQNGTWADVTPHVDIDPAAREVTLPLRDGGLGDADGVANGVIQDPTGISTAANTITVTKMLNPSALADSFTFKLEKCSNTNATCSGGSYATVANVGPGTPDLGNGESFNWTGLTAPTGGQTYRLSESGISSPWTTPSISCTNGVTTTNYSSGTNRGVTIRLTGTLNNTQCTFTNSRPVATIQVHKAGDRKADGSLAPLQDAVYRAYTSSALTTAAGSCTTNASGACNIANLLPNTNYWVKETAAPSTYNVIPTIYTSASGNSTYVEQVTTGGANSSTNTRTFANRLDNPTLPNVCGLKVALVFDLSNSISTAELTDMKTAAKDFVTTLEGTPSSFSGYTFATAAPAAGNSNLALTNVASTANADAVRTWIGNRTLPGSDDGGTNWDMGLRQLSGAGVNLVLFLTDGSPTFYGTGPSGTGSDTTFREVEEAVASANLVKSKGPRIVPVGVGLPTGADANLKAISGPTLNDDYFLATDYAALKAKMQEIATQLCGGTVSVTKQVQTGASTWVNAPGWTFNASPNATPTSGVTDANGAVNFDFSTLPATVTVTEDQQAGYTLVQQGGFNAACVKGAANTPVTVADATVGGKAGVSFTLSKLDTVKCTFRNAPTPATITMRKETAGGVGGPFELKLTGPNGTSVTNNLTTTAGTNPVAGAATTGLYPGSYVITETALAGWNLTGVDCGTVDLANRKTTIALTPGANVVCTFTNSSTQATINVNKTTTGLAGGPFTFRLNGAVAGQLSGTTDAAGVAKGMGSWTVAAGSNNSVTEVAPGPAWAPNAALSKCYDAGDANKTPLTSPFTAVGGKTYTCDFVNDAAKATINVNKTTTGAFGGPFTFQLNGAVGNQISGSTTAAGVSRAMGSWTVDAASSNAVTELNTGPAWNLNGTLSKCYDAADAGKTALTSPFIATAGKTYTCDFVNDAAPATIDVYKTTTAISGGPFTFQLNGGSPKSGDTAIAGTAAKIGSWSVAANSSNTVSENAPSADWVPNTALTKCVDAADPGVKLAAPFTALGGHSYRCDFTNDPAGSSIRIYKTTTTLAGGPFSFTVNQLAAASGSTLTPGAATLMGSVPAIAGTSYTVAESAPDAAWVPNVALTKCYDTAAPTVTLPTPFIAAAGKTYNCEFTNDPATSAIKVNKMTTGLAGGPFSFTLNGGQTKSNSTTAPNVNTAVGSWTVDAGSSNQVVELNAGSQWNLNGTLSKCYDEADPAHTALPSPFTAGAAQTYVCDFVNDPAPVSIEVTKTTSGIAGGPFTFHLNDGSPLSGATSTAGVAAVIGNWPVTAGASYTVTEADPGPAWNPNTAQSKCYDAADVDKTPLVAPFTVTAGRTYRCDFVNDPAKASIEVFKTTTGIAGGPFTFHLNGTDPKVGSTDVVETAKSFGTWSVAAGSSNTVTEVNAGSAWVLNGNRSKCYDEADPAHTALPSPFVAVGAHAYRCDFVNDPAGASIAVQKKTLGHPGGLFSFTLNGADATKISGSTATPDTFETIGSWDVAALASATVAEQSPANWVPVSAACSDNTASDTDLGVTFTPQPGHAYTCRFVNQRLGSITIHKTSVGGTGTFDFTLTHGGAAVYPLDTAGANPATKAVTDLVPGSYSLAETGVDATQWVSGPIACYRNGANEPFTIGAAASIELASGDAIDCFATNTKRAVVTVQKSTIGGDGSFTFDLSGGTPNVTSPAMGNGGTYTWGSIAPGAQVTLSENAPNADGFKLSGRDCALTSGPGSVAWTTSGAAAVAITPAAGQHITCTFTNQKQGSLSVEKTSIGATGAFTVTAGSLGSKILDTAVANPATAGWTDVAPGTYTVAETVDGSWVSTIECFKNGAAQPFASGTTGTEVTIAAGDTVLCKLENTKKGSILVQKKTVGGVGGPFAFTLDGGQTRTVTTTDGAPTPVTGGAWTGLDPATTHAVAEADPGARWQVGPWECRINGDLVKGGANPLAAVPVAAGQQTVCTITNTRAVDLGVEKTASTHAATAGGDFTYTVKVTNHGPSSSDSQGFTDTLPAGLALGAPTFTDNGFDTCVAPEAGGVITITCARAGALATGVSVAVTIRVHVAADYAGTSIKNCAVVAGDDNATGDEAPDTSCVTVSVGRDVNLVLDKSGPGTATAGGTVTYTLDVRNTGISNATVPATVRDVLPTGLTIVSVAPATGAAGTGIACAPGSDWTVGGTTLSCTIATGQLTAGGGAKQIVVVAAIAGNVTGSVTNPALVTSTDDPANCTIGGADPCPPGNDNYDTVTTTVKAEVDLSIAKSAPTTAVAGDPNGFLYTIAVTNNGPSTSTAQGISDTLPAGLTLVNPAPADQTVPSAGAWTCSGATTVTCARTGSLTVGQSTSITLEVKVDAGFLNAHADMLFNCATVTGDVDVTSEVGSANNTSCAGTTVEPKVDLTIDKSGPASALAGEAISYSVVIGNVGPSDASADATVDDVLPAGITLGTVTGPAGVVCTPAVTTFSCTVPKGQLTVGASVTVTVTANVAANATPGDATNRARVTSTEDPAPCVIGGEGVQCTTGDPNYDEVTTTVGANSVLTIEKSPKGQTFVAGRSATYTIEVTNHGPSDATVADVTDKLPAGADLAAVSDITAPGFNCAASDPGTDTVACSLSGTFPAGTTKTISVEVMIAAGFEGDSIRNCTTVIDAEQRSAKDCATNGVDRKVDLAIDKRGPVSAVAGGTISYTLTVHNVGPSDAAEDATVLDVLPAGVTVKSVATGSGVECTFAVGAPSVSCTVDASRLAVGGAPVVITVVVDIAPDAPEGAAVNRTTVGSDDDPTPCDLTATTGPSACPPVEPSNNYDDVTTDVTHVSAVTIVKTAAEKVAVPGTTVTYTLKVSNPGPSVAKNVEVADTVPTGMSLPSLDAIVAPGWDCSGSDTGTGLVLCNYTANDGIMTVAPAVGSSSTITVTALLDPAFTGSTIENCAEVWHAGMGESEENVVRADGRISAQWTGPPADSNCVTLPVEPAVDLRIEKEAPATVAVGTDLTYSLKVTNLGPSVATGVTITDPLPTGVSFVSASTGCTLASQVLTCEAGTLVAGASASFTVTVSVPVSTATSRITNTATVAGDQKDVDPGNNTDTAVTDTVVVEGKVNEKNPTTPTAVAPKGNLPFTGGDVLGYGVTALLLLGLGALLVLVTRRRRTRDAA